MKDIDWSKAPEWATKHGNAGHALSSVWFNDHKYTYCDEQQGGRAFLFAGERQYSFNDITGITNRPSLAWNGEGLPPVGTVCAVMDARINIWNAVDEIIGHASLSNCEVAVFRIGDYIAYSPADQFRPIRTPDQVAADERASAVNDLLSIYLDGAKGHVGGINAIYDAGYRKP